MNIGRYIYRYISSNFLFIQVLYSEYHCAAAADSVRIIGLFRKGHTVRQSTVGPDATAFARAGKSLSSYMRYLGLETQLF